MNNPAADTGSDPSAGAAPPARASLPLLLICSVWNVLLIAGVCFALLRNDQAHDALLAMSESGWYGFARLTLTVVAAVVCAVVNWHMLRRVQMLVYPMPRKPEHEQSAPEKGVARAAKMALGSAAFFADKATRKSTVETLKSAYFLPETGVARNLARVVSALPLFALAAILVVLSPDTPFWALAVLSVLVWVATPVLLIASCAGDPVGQAPARLARMLCWLIALYLVTVALQFLGGAWARRAALLGHAGCAFLLCVGLYSAAAARRSTDGERTLPNVFIQALRSPFVPGGGWTGLIPVVACFVILTIFAFVPARSAALGPMAIVLLGAAFWGAFGAAVVILLVTRLRKNRKWWPVIPALFIGLIYALLFSPSDKRLVRLLDSADATEPRLINEAIDAWPADQPIVLVAAEGGGIYAAYLTSQVLGHVEDTLRSGAPAQTFGDRIFAISGVSGGSVGATLYTALLRAGALNFTDTSDRILSHDLLSAVLAAFVGRDLVPAPLGWFDRTRALEDAIAHAWASEGPASFDLASAPFSRLDPPPGEGPNLFLNSTLVSKGEPRFVGPLRFANADGGQFVYQNVENPGEMTGPINLSIATGAVLSARFPIVTTAGKIIGVGDERFAYVDGGYFENSGCATLEQVYDTLRAARPDQEILVLRIGVEPADLPEYKAGDLLSPLATLVNTRGAHGRDARERFERRVLADGNTWWNILLRLSVDGHEIPLGWQLSRLSREQIREQVTQSAEVAAVIERMRSAS